MVNDTIDYLRSQEHHVIYDAKYWLDGYKHNPDYALQTLFAAIASGVRLVLCDPNGGIPPRSDSNCPIK